MKWLYNWVIVKSDLSYSLIHFLIITLVFVPSAGTSLWAESEVQGGEVYHRAVPHDKGQRLGLRGEIFIFLHDFFKRLHPLDLKKGSSVAFPHPAYEPSLCHTFHFAKNSMWWRLYLFLFLVFLQRPRQHICWYLLSQLLVVLGHGLNECRVCVWKTGGDVVTQARVHVGF